MMFGVIHEISTFRFNSAARCRKCVKAPLRFLIELLLSSSGIRLNLEQRHEEECIFLVDFQQLPFGEVFVIHPTFSRQGTRGLSFQQLIDPTTGDD